MSQEFSKTNSCLLGALSWLDGFLLNPLIQCHSGSVPERFRNTYGESQGTNEDRSQSTQDFGRDDAFESVVFCVLLRKLFFYPAPIQVYFFVHSMLEKIWKLLNIVILYQDRFDSHLESWLSKQTLKSPLNVDIDCFSPK